MLVSCEDCAEVAFVIIACTQTLDTDESQSEGNGDGDGDDDDGPFTVGVIAGIAAAAGGVVLLLCCGFLFVARRKNKKNNEGNSTFADESDHDARLKAARTAGTPPGTVVNARTGNFNANADPNADSANGSTTASNTSRGIGFGRARSRSKTMAKSKGSASGKSDGKTAAAAAASAGVVGEVAGASVSASGHSAPSANSAGGSDRKAPRLFPSGANAKSFRPGHQGVESSSYDGMFASQGSGAHGGSGGGSAGGPRHDTRHESRAGSMDVDTRKDSMSVAAAAAAARAAAKARGEDKGPTPPLGSVLHSGVVHEERRVEADAAIGARSGARTGPGADAGGGFTWSAGQDVYPRRAHGGGGGHAAAAAFVAGEDSAAGSVYSAAAGQEYDEDDEDYYYPDEADPQQHTYNDECGESVPASSPGAYSMYSHYTAGGGAYRAGLSEAAWSSDGDEEDGGLGAGGPGSVGGGVGRGRQQRVRSAQPAMVIPAPSVPPPAVVLEVKGGVEQPTAKMLSPAGHRARVDRNSLKRDVGPHESGLQLSATLGRRSQAAVDGVAVAESGGAFLVSHHLGERFHDEQDEAQEEQEALVAEP
eukprot:jgi/Undpi1/13353/HiC_scaffold_8.g03012.m1